MPTRSFPALTTRTPASLGGLVGREDSAAKADRLHGKCQSGHMEVHVVSDQPDGWPCVCEERGHFVIDRVAGAPVVYASPCSGHGFKFATAIGELLARMSLGEVETVGFLAFDRLRVPR